MDVLKGEKTVEFSEIRQKPTSGTLTTSSHKNPVDIKPKSLIEILKAVRKKEAQKLSMPPYLVFNDASLADMSKRLPTTREEFSMVNGVGEKKLEKFWRPFTQAISDYLSGTVIR